MKYFPPRYLLRRYEILKRVRPAHCFLEIGAGEFALSQELLAYFKRGQAIDFSPAVADLYQQLPPAVQQRLSFDSISIADLPTDVQYDCVVACEVMEHIEDDLAFLHTVHCLLTTNGQVILSVPAHMKFWTLHDEITGHVRRYEKADLLALMQRAGFQQVQVISYGYPVINLLWRLRALYAKRQAGEKQQWDAQQQTQQSGVLHVPRQWDVLGWLVNPYTFLPLNWLASMFNAGDRSEGYLVVGYK